MKCLLLCRSTGFILEGFPRTTDEAEYLGDKGLFPDAALILAVEDTDVIGRLLPPKLDKWKQKRDKKLAKKKRMKDRKEKKRVSLWDVGIFIDVYWRRGLVYGNVLIFYYVYWRSGLVYGNVLIFYYVYWRSGLVYGMWGYFMMFIEEEG